MKVLRLLPRRKPKVFICYRRGDSRADAGRIHADLGRHFGKKQVFFDIDTMRGGDDFVEVIEKFVGSCDVFIAVIGKQWLTISDGGIRRLDKPDDFVRLEIAIALKRGIPIIPVLVGSATPPPPQGLPSGLEALAHRHAVELSDTRWEYDVGRLIDRIKERLPEQPIAWQKLGMIASCVALLLLGFVILPSLRQYLTPSDTDINTASNNKVASLDSARNSLDANAAEPPTGQNRNLSVNASNAGPIKIEPRSNENVKSLATSTSTPTPNVNCEEEIEIYRVWNNDEVAMNKPTSDSQFKIDEPRCIKTIYTRHKRWDRTTMPSGYMKLLNSAGEEVGAWPVYTNPDDEKYWDTWSSTPKVQLSVGTYTVIDPDPATWSHNAGSKNRGMFILQGPPVSGKTK